MKTIAVFGSSKIDSDSEDYIASYEVGKILGTVGYAVMTGGYAGVMEAVSKGAAEVGGHVIGVTVSSVERHHSSVVNKWVKEHIHCNTLVERLMYLVQNADGYVILPGGIGTLNELILTWELMYLHEIKFNPIVCYSTYWDSVLAGLKDNSYMKAGVWDYLKFANSPDCVIDLLK